MANTRLSRTAGAPTLNTKYTISVWIKRAKLTGDGFILDGYVDASNRFKFAFQSANKLEIWNSHSGSDTFALNTNRVFQDTNGWYNIVLSVDTTQATDTNRVKLYVNGVQETDLATNNSPAINEANNVINESGATISIGDYYSGSNAFGGCMSHFHFVDGTAYDASNFGSTDSTTGEWEINTSPTLTYGNNGFFILKNDNVINDQSGNANNFTLSSGTLTKTEDCPSNVFATMNPLDNYWQGSTLSNGDTTVLTGSSSTTYNTSSIMVNTGKFYAECKVITGSATANIGIAGEMADAAVGVLKAKEFGYAYIDDGQFGNNGSASSYGASYANGDIIGIALDCTNNKLYFSKNGVFQDSGNPSAGSGGKTITAPASTPIGNYAFACNDTWNDNTRTFSWNFGNGFFGTTAVSSAGTAASTPGIFEYDVPTGYQPLSTKGLNA